MNATKTETRRFFSVKLDADLPGLRYIDVVVDTWSSERVGDGEYYAATHTRAYARPANVKWCLAMSPNGNPFYADREWLSSMFTIIRPVKEGDVIDAGDYLSGKRITAAHQPSLFGLICSAFGMENPTT